MYPVVNTEQAQAWNGYEDFHWADNHDRWNAVSAAVNDDLLAATGIDDRTRILDIGCGTGQTTRLAARRARHGLAVGVDLSGPMLVRARVTAGEEGITNVRFEQGDAQVFPFGQGDFDVAISQPILVNAAIGSAKNRIPPHLPGREAVWGDSPQSAQRFILALDG